MATSRSCVAALGAAVILAVAGCTSGSATAGHPDRSAASSTRARTAAAPTSRPPAPKGLPSDGGTALGTPPCLVNTPPAWTRAKAAGELWHGAWAIHSTQAPTPEGTGVLIQRDAETTVHVLIVGRNQEVVEDLGTVPRPKGELSQLTFDAIDADHVVFAYSLTNGEAASWRWQLYSWDRHAHKLTLVTANPVDGHGNPLHGGWVHPVLTRKYLYWIQAAPDTTGGWGGSELMQYTFATGRTRRLYRGLTEALVPYGDLVLYTALTPGTKPPGETPGQGVPEVVQAVRQDDGTPAPAPQGISLGTDGADTMVSDGDLVAWSAASGAINAWRPEWGRTIVLVPGFSQWPLAQKLGMSDPTMLRLYGHFLVFNPSVVYVLDLTTNSFTPLTSRPSGEDVSGSWLQLSEFTTKDSYNKETLEEQSNQHLLNLAELPDLPGCGH